MASKFSFLEKYKREEKTSTDPEAISGERKTSFIDCHMTGSSTVPTTLPPGFYSPKTYNSPHVNMTEL